MNMYLNRAREHIESGKKSKQKLTGYNAEILPQNYIKSQSFETTSIFSRETADQATNVSSVRKYRLTCLKINGSYKCKYMFIIYHYNKKKRIFGETNGQANQLR